MECKDDYYNGLLCLPHPNYVRVISKIDNRKKTLKRETSKGSKQLWKVNQK